MDSNKQVDDFPVFLIKSKWSLNAIRELINYYSESTYSSSEYMRIIFDREGRETDLTICILNDKTYENLCNAGYNNMKRFSEFEITPYGLINKNFPGEGQTENLFVPVPKNLGFQDSEIFNMINIKLDYLVKNNILPPSSWEIKTPLISREKGGIKGGCFIKFKEDVEEESKAMVRILLHDTYWDPDSDDGHILKCYWAREQVKRPYNNNNSKNKNKPHNRLKIVFIMTLIVHKKNLLK